MNWNWLWNTLLLISRAGTRFIARYVLLWWNVALYYAVMINWYELCTLVAFSNFALQGLMSWFLSVIFFSFYVVLIIIINAWFLIREVFKESAMNCLMWGIMCNKCLFATAIIWGFSAMDSLSATPTLQRMTAIDCFNCLSLSVIHTLLDRSLLLGGQGWLIALLVAYSTNIRSDGC